MGFVRLGTGGRGGSGEDSYNPKILFDLPVCQYSYLSGDYMPEYDKNGFCVYYSGSRNNSDNEGLALLMTGLNPLKSYRVDFTLKADKSTSTASSGNSNAVGFCQGFINFKSSTDNRVFCMTDSSHKYGHFSYIRMLFSNNAFGGIIGEEMTNYIPITSVSTTPASYSLTVKKGCNNAAFLCFDLSYPNSGDIFYYFENFVISPIEEASTVISEPLRLSYISAQDRNVRGTSTFSNLPITNVYEVLKVNVKGKCNDGSFELVTDEFGNNDHLNPNLSSSGTSYAVLTTSHTIAEFDHIGVFEKTYILGVKGSQRLKENFEIKAYYYPDSNSVYTDDAIEVTYEITGSATVNVENTYSTKGDELYCSCSSLAEAETIATNVDIELKEFVQNESRAYFYTAEEMGAVIVRARSMGYWLSPVFNPGTIQGVINVIG